MINMSDVKRTIIYAADTAELEDEGLYSKAYSSVTNERRKKTDGLCCEADKRLSLGAELLLSCALKGLKIDLKEVRYGYGEKGKPYLIGREGIHFNLSHSGRLVICAISPMEVGCDVEKISDKKTDIAKRFFDEREYEMICEKKTDKQRKEMFFRLWTLKESFIKATGMGMSQALRSFLIEFDTDGLVKNIKNNDKTYYFREINLCEDYMCAVCGLDSKIKENGVSVERISFKERGCSGYEK